LFRVRRPPRSPTEIFFVRRREPGGFPHPYPRMHVGLLGPCYKTGRSIPRTRLAILANGGRMGTLSVPSVRCPAPKDRGTNFAGYRFALARLRGFSPELRRRENPSPPLEKKIPAKPNPDEGVVTRTERGRREGGDSESRRLTSVTRYRCLGPMHSIKFPRSGGSRSLLGSLPRCPSPHRWERDREGKKIIGNRESRIPRTDASSTAALANGQNLSEPRGRFYFGTGESDLGTPPGSLVGGPPLPVRPTE